MISMGAALLTLGLTTPALAKLPVCRGVTTISEEWPDSLTCGSASATCDEGVSLTNNCQHELLVTLGYLSDEGPQETTVPGMSTTDTAGEDLPNQAFLMSLGYASGDFELTFRDPKRPETVARWVFNVEMDFPEDGGGGLAGRCGCATGGEGWMWFGAMIPLLWRRRSSS